MFWTVLFAVTVSGPTFALTATTDQLGAADFRDREAAARILRGAGPSAIGPLMTATRSPDPEVRRQAAILLERIETDRLGAPTLVSLHADRRPIAELVAALVRQSGYSVSLDPTDTPAGVVTLHRDRVPFWGAIDALCATAGLAAELEDDGRIHLRTADATDPFVSYAGPFRVAATDLSVGQRRQLAGLPRRRLPPTEPEQLILACTLTAEPKATVVGVTTTVHAAIDDSGLSLKPPTETTRSSLSPPVLGRRSLTHGFALDMQRRGRHGTTIRAVRGAMTVTLLAGTTAELTLDRPAEAMGRTARGRRHTLTVTATAEANGLFAFDLAVARTAESTDGWQVGLHERLELTDTTGAIWPVAGVVYRDVDGHLARFRVEFRPPAADAKPARLTLVEWRTLTREVAFEFRDIPLP